MTMTLSRRTRLSRTTAPLLGIAALAALGMAASPQAAHAQAPTPIAGTGYNQDVVLENGANGNFAQEFDANQDGHRFAWIEDGLGGYQGLPKEGAPNTTVTVASAATNTVTGGHTTFLFQSYGGANGAGSNNVLLDTQASNSSTFTLTTPAAYTSLAVDAASTNSTSTSTGTLLLTFVGGKTSSPISFNAFDWGNNGGNTTQTVLSSDVARGGSGSNSNSSNVYIDPQGNIFNLYETDINLASLGYGGQALQSITFTGVSDTISTTGIFGVSGVAAPAAAPEPSQFAAFGIGLLGLGGLAFKARKRRIAA